MPRKRRCLVPAWSCRLQEICSQLLSREYYAFFDLALLLVLVLAFAGLAVFLPDWHPHVLHIFAPFKKVLTTEFIEGISRYNHKA